MPGRILVVDDEPLKRITLQIELSEHGYEVYEAADAEAARRVLLHPAVADKTFLVTIGDRTVGGLCSRDPMVGPWQVPVADCATTLLSFDGYAGEAFALGERAPLAVIDAPASGRMAVAESVDSDSAQKIEIAIAARIPEMDAASSLEKNLVALVGGKQQLLFRADDRSETHAQVTSVPKPSLVK